MKRCFIIFIILELNCSSYLFHKVGGYSGKPLDYFLNEVPKKDRICKFTDEEFHKSYFNYSEQLSKVGFIIGFLTDVTLSIYYGLQNPKIIPIIGGILYSIGSYFTQFIDMFDNRFPRKIDSSDYGWVYNKKSKCTNLSDFYVETIFLQNKKNANCNLLKIDAIEEFYEKLAVNIDVEEKKLSAFKKSIQPINLLFIESDWNKGNPNCTFKFYIEYAGGKDALEEKFKIKVN